MLIFSKENFLRGAIGLWNPYMFSGAPMSVAGGTPILVPEDWLLFLVPSQFLFFSITLLAFLKTWFVGIAAYHFYSAELLNRRWALFASMVYQLSGWMIWSITLHETLSVSLYFIILLALIWTMNRRSALSNYLLLSIVTAMLLMSGNIAHGSYALLGAGVLLLYRAWTRRDFYTAARMISVFAGSSATAILIFSVRLLPIVESLRSGTRITFCCPPFFGNASFLIARFFDTEIFGVFYGSSADFFRHMSPLFEGFHLHGAAPGFFGVSAALLVLWALVSEKSSVRMAFWSVYTVIALSLITSSQPFDVLARVLLSPIYHPMGPQLLLPIGFAAVAALGGMAIEGALRRGRVSRAAFQLFAFGLVTAGFFILMVIITEVSISSVGARALIIGAIMLVIVAVLAYRVRPSLLRATALPLLWVIAAVNFAMIMFVHPDNPEFLSHLKILASGLLLFAGFAIVMVLAVGGRAIEAWRLGTWGGAALILLCLVVSLVPWTSTLQQGSSDLQSMVLALLGATRFVLGASIFCLMLAAPHGRIPARSVYLIVVFLVLAEQVPAGKVHSYIVTNPFYSAINLYPPRAQFIGADHQVVEPNWRDYRVNFPNSLLNPPFYNELYGSQHEICASINVAYAVRSYGGYSNNMPERTANFVRNFAPAEAQDAFCIYARATNDRFLDLSGVGYNYDGKTGTVFERPGALSRMMLFTRFEKVSDDSAVLQRLSSPDFRPLEQLVVQADPGFQSYASRGNAQKLSFTEVTPDHVETRVQTDGPALVWFGDSYNPGWIAEVNGRPQEIMLADYNFMAIPVPAGDNRLVLRYKPRVFLIGAICAAVGVAVLMLAFILYLALRIRARVQATGKTNWIARASIQLNPNERT
jgi:hypothetical protein